MDGRISAWLLSLPLAALCGCVTTTTSNSDVGMPDTPKIVKNEGGRKRNPQPSTEIAFGKMKEMEADTEALKKHPEAQARLRDEARLAYQKALKIDPSNLEAQRHLGRLYTKIGDYQRAYDVLRQALAKNPRDAGLWNELGQCHRRRKDFNEAARCFTKALEIEPENRQYMKSLGFTLAWSGHIDQALPVLTRAQGAGPAHLTIARVLGLKDHIEPARQHLLLARRADGSLMDEARVMLEALDRGNAGGSRAGVLGRPNSGG